MNQPSESDIARAVADATANPGRTVEVALDLPRTVTVQDIQRLVVHPGETLLVTLPGHADPDQLARVSEQFKAHLPEGVTVLVKTADVKVEVIEAVGE